MPSQPTSALILLGDGLAELKSKQNQDLNRDLTELERSQAPALDEMAKKGCAGELLLEEEEVKGESKGESKEEEEEEGLKDRILQLLGIRLGRATGITVRTFNRLLHLSSSSFLHLPFVSSLLCLHRSLFLPNQLDGSKTYLQDRYRGARFAMLSNSPQAISLTKSLGFATTILYPNLQSDQESILSKTKELLGGNGQPQTAEFVFCCFVKGQEPAGTSLRLLGELAKSFDAVDSSVLRVTVVSYGNVSGGNKTAIEAMFPRGDSEVHGFKLPKQSYETYERQDIKTQRY